MEENARQGFWNGSRPPLGYRVIIAEQHGAKLKKKLEIDPTQAEKVRKICKAAHQGVDGSGPMGLKSIATWLNANDLRTKDGAYRYYTCSTKARTGKEGCTGITVPMSKLDDAVVAHLESRLVQTDRFFMLMGNVLDRRVEWIDRRRSHVGELRKRSAEAASKLTRLYAAIEDGLVGQGAEGLKDRIREPEAIKVEATADADRAEAAIERLGPMITPETIERMAGATRESLRDADGKYRRAQVRAVAQRVEVLSTQEIKIMGSRSELLRTLVAASGGRSGVAGVQSSVLKWRTRHDSNV